jgi:hypothetical protein
MKRLLVALSTALACLWSVPSFATASGQLTNGRTQFINGSGSPLAAGTVSIYQPGTTTPVTTYQDSGLTTANSWPIVLDSNGMASIWMAPGNYREVVQDALGNTLFDQTTSTTGYASAGSVPQVSAMAAGTIVGNNTASTASSANLTGAQVAAMIPGVARAWVSFGGSTTNGTQSIYKSVNVSSVTRNSAGNYTVTFISAMADQNYAASVTCSVANSANSTTIVDVSYSTVVSGSFSFWSNNPSGTGVDCQAYYISVQD